MARIVKFELPLTATDRVRHFHQVEKGQIKSFTVQYETFLKDKWNAVVRFDTAHGFAHRDLIHIGGSQEKKEFDFENFNDALTFAEDDIRSNWQQYKLNYLKELENG